MNLARAVRGDGRFGVLVVALLVAAAVSPAPAILTALAAPPRVLAHPASTTTSPPPAAPSPRPVPVAAAPPVPTTAGGPPVTAPEPPADPVVACPIDDVSVLLDGARSALGGLLGAPTFGSSLPDLARLATGCGAVDPTTALLALVIDLSRAIPDLGLPDDVLPDLPPLDLSVIPPGVLAALAPLGDGVRQACAQLPTVTLLLSVVVPALQLPINQGDVLNLLSPTVSLCALFPSAAAS